MPSDVPTDETNLTSASTSVSSNHQEEARAVKNSNPKIDQAANNFDSSRDGGTKAWWRPLNEVSEKGLKEYGEIFHSLQNESYPDYERSELENRKKEISNMLRENRITREALLQENSRIIAENLSISEEMDRKNSELWESDRKISGYVKELEHIQKKNKVQIFFDSSEHLYLDIHRRMTEEEEQTIVEKIEKLVSNYEVESENYASNIKTVSELNDKIKALYSNSELYNKKTVTPTDQTIVLHKEYLSTFKAAFEKTVTREK